MKTSMNVATQLTIHVTQTYIELLSVLLKIYTPLHKLILCSDIRYVLFSNII